MLQNVGDDGDGDDGGDGGDTDSALAAALLVIKGIRKDEGHQKRSGWCGSGSGPVRTRTPGDQDPPVPQTGGGNSLLVKCGHFRN